MMAKLENILAFIYVELRVQWCKLKHSLAVLHGNNLYRFSDVFFKKKA